MSFDSGYQRWRLSRGQASLLGEGYPETIEPFSFVPFTSLSDLAAVLDVEPGQTLVDLACGRGGVGLWLADETGSDLIGVDSSAIAVADARAQARQHPRQRPGQDSARFVVADAAKTGLAGGRAHAVVCIDALQLMPDPVSVAHEIGRLLRPGGVLVLTMWEGLDSAPARFPRRIAAMLDRVGFVSIEVCEHPDWLGRQLGIYTRAIERAAAGEADDAVRDLANEAISWQSIHPLVRRVSVTARMP